MSEPAANFTPPVPDAAEISRLFPAFRIEGLIGAGRSGAVFKARQISLDRDVAIKILPREFTDDAGYQTRFSASVMAMARLNHPNLIGIYDFGETEGLLFVIMEFVQGKSLFHSAHGKAISAFDAARIVAGICEGLAHAHEHGIVHRDLNPANILLTPKAEPKIGDFDIARRHGAANPESFPYAAPELLASPELADSRTDIFAVGIILHELLAGSHPVADPRPPSAIAGCDPRFDAVVRRASHPSPGMRYPDASAMRRELLEILDSLPNPKLRTATAAPGTATPARPLPPPRATTPVKSSSSAVPWIAAAVVILLGGLAFFALSGGNSNPPAGPSTVSGESRASKPKPANRNRRPKREHRPKMTIDPDSEPYVPPPPLDIDLDDPTPSPDVADEPTEPESDTADQTPPADTGDIADTGDTGDTADTGDIAEVPDTEPSPEQPETEPAPTPESTFDTVGWLEMARGKMKEKAKPVMAGHQKKIIRNFDDFRRGVKKVLRQIDNRDRREIEKKADALIDKCRESGARVPEAFDFGLGKVAARGRSKEEKQSNATLLNHSKDLLAEFHKDALAKQAEIDRDFAADMLALSQTYILGVELQVQRLKDADDPIAAETLQDEADATRDRPERFTRLMQGLDPDPPPPPEPTDKKN